MPDKPIDVSGHFHGKDDGGEEPKELNGPLSYNIDPERTKLEGSVGWSSLPLKSTQPSVIRMFEYLSYQWALSQKAAEHRNRPIVSDFKPGNLEALNEVEDDSPDMYCPLCDGIEIDVTTGNVCPRCRGLGVIPRPVHDEYSD